MVQEGCAQVKTQQHSMQVSGAPTTVSGAPTTVSGAPTTISGVPVAQSQPNFTAFIGSILPQPIQPDKEKMEGPIDLLAAAQPKTPEELFKGFVEVRQSAQLVPENSRSNPCLHVIVHIACICPCMLAVGRAAHCVIFSLLKGYTTVRACKIYLLLVCS